MSKKVPHNTIKETKVAQVLSIELPGVYKKDIKITLENDQLKIEGVRDKTVFSYLFAVIESNNTTASYENGILTIILYREKSNIKEIKIT